MRELQFHSNLPVNTTSDFAGADGVAGFGLVAFGALRFPFVVELFPLCQRYFAFYPAILQVHAGGNQREPFFAGGGQQFIDLAAVQQKLAGAYGRVVGAVAVAVFGDMGVVQPGFVASIMA